MVKGKRLFRVFILEKIVREYYDRIDAGDVDWVVGMFAKNAVYDRAGQLITGTGEIRAFYAGERKVTLTHSKIKLWACGRDIFVEGTYSGTGADGSERLGQFSDHWTFNAAGKVTLRRTSLFTGADTIKA